MTGEEKQSEARPPVPPLIFRVGFTGHRWNRLDQNDAVLLDAIRGTLGNVLRTVAEAVHEASEESARVLGQGKGTPVLRLLSQLAEGSDRIAAEVAVECRNFGQAYEYELNTLYPYPKNLYRKEDFKTDESRKHFDRLDQQATRTFELDGKPLATESYAEAANFLLEQCDVLVAVWDGDDSAGPGGTTDMMEEAIRKGLPTVVILTQEPTKFHMARRGLKVLVHPAEKARDQLTDCVKKSVMLHTEHPYWTEKWPTRVCDLWTRLVRFMGSSEWRGVTFPALRSECTDVRQQCLKKHFHWLDKLGLYYGELSRTSTLMFQVLAMVAVSTALASLALDKLVPDLAIRVMAVGELAAVAAIIWLGWATHKKGWHQRWMLYRALAEQLRCLDFLLPLGMDLPRAHGFGFGAHESDDVRFERSVRAAIARQDVGKEKKEANAAYLDIQCAHMRDVIHDQLGYHLKSAERFGRMEETFRLWGIVLFVLTGILCLVDVWHAFPKLIPAALAAEPSCCGAYLEEWHHRLEMISKLSAALLPALAAAVTGLASQGEVRRLAQRSESMAGTLKKLHEDMDSTLKQTEDVKGRVVHVEMRHVMEWARRLAEVLSFEVRDWQILVSGKPPERS